jgi:hypothetical protein
MVPCGTSSQQRDGRYRIISAFDKANGNLCRSAIERSGFQSPVIGGVGSAMDEPNAVLFGQESGSMTGTVAIG